MNTSSVRLSSSSRHTEAHEKDAEQLVMSISSRDQVLRKRWPVHERQQRAMSAVVEYVSTVNGNHSLETIPTRDVHDTSSRTSRLLSKELYLQAGRQVDNGLEASRQQPRCSSVMPFEPQQGGAVGTDSNRQTLEPQEGYGNHPDQGESPGDFSF